MEENSSSSTNPAWQNCSHCPSLVFSTAAEFERHILDKHSIKEGTIILCQYGQNGMCSALQFGDLRKAGFKYHIREYHTYTRTPNESWTFYSSSQNLPAVLNDPNRDVSQMEDVNGSDNEEIWSAEELTSIEDKLKKMIVSLSDYCNERCANLIVTKTDKDYVCSDMSQLSLLSNLIKEFCTKCEDVTGYCSNAMNLALRSFAMKYIQTLHTERRSQLTASLNAERWKTADVPYELQSAITKICEIQEIPPNLLYESGKPDGKYLFINKESYALVGTVQLLIKILLEYCDATRQSPIIVQYLVHCMLELLRLFNSRCCQLVLGAGAIQSAGLKTISTSNLALVSRSLQVILWFLPMIKQLLEKIHSSEVSLSGFVAIESDIASHKQEIENKICLIVSNMLCSQLTGWDAKPPVPSQTFRNISKHLVKLHEALIDILPPEQIKFIYKRVHDNFKDKLREQLIKMNIVANGSPQHGVVTSELTFYLQTLKTLRVINDNDAEDNILYDVWLN
ncbi:vacuolar protein sorting-associated protein 54 isoform X2 [Bombyx mori]|uniref:vacuolar protein sorting-associated protein 54 isoform X2 n=1 Tax=Bombyx mori TaxID=7091 RepID=UPI002ED0CC62